ncbi:MAG: hypothetical protein AMXMBFR66_37160 [Pseudomonadota bacterium]|nr:response regulator [Rubrivivax sp.]
MRVLYVDDDRVQAVLFAEACRALGDVEIECAACGAEALELLAEFRPDLLVLDLHLPDTNGAQLLPELRRALGREVPAILCTAEDDAPARRAAAAGFDGCWSKPVDVAVVMTELVRRAAGSPPLG